VDCVAVKIIIILEFTLNLLKSIVMEETPEAIPRGPTRVSGTWLGLEMESQAKECSHTTVNQNTLAKQQNLEVLIARSFCFKS